MRDMISNKLKCLFGFHELKLSVRKLTYNVTGTPLIRYAPCWECVNCRYYRASCAQFNTMEDAEEHKEFIIKLREKHGIK